MFLNYCLFYEDFEKVLHQKSVEIKALKKSKRTISHLDISWMKQLASSLHF
jgi:hypothetical protein